MATDRHMAEIVRPWPVHVSWLQWTQDLREWWCTVYCCAAETEPRAGGAVATYRPDTGYRVYRSVGTRRNTTLLSSTYLSQGAVRPSTQSLCGVPGDGVLSPGARVARHHHWIESRILSFGFGSLIRPLEFLRMGARSPWGPWRPLRRVSFPSHRISPRSQENRSARGMAQEISLINIDRCPFCGNPITTLAPHRGNPGAGFRMPCLASGTPRRGCSVWDRSSGPPRSASLWGTHPPKANNSWVLLYVTPGLPFIESCSPVVVTE